MLSSEKKFQIIINNIVIQFVDKFKIESNTFRVHLLVHDAVKTIDNVGR